MCVPVWYLDVRIPDSQEFPDEWKHLEVTRVCVPGWSFDVCIPRQFGIPRRVETSGKPICLHSGWRSLGARSRVEL